MEKWQNFHVNNNLSVIICSKCVSQCAPNRRVSFARISNVICMVWGVGVMKGTYNFRYENSYLCGKILISVGLCIEPDRKVDNRTFYSVDEKHMKNSFLIDFVGRIFLSQEFYHFKIFNKKIQILTRYNFKAYTIYMRCITWFETKKNCP